jgi:hypothetical protein
VVLPYVAITLAVIIGLAALALDGSRLMTMQTQAQGAADALALAGAAELDRRPDSVNRARAAIQDLLNNPVSAAGNGQTAKVSGIEFLQSLPASDDSPITAANLTDDPTLAAYVQVSLAPMTMQPLFPLSVAAERGGIAVGAQAVAGYDQIVCDATPLYVCNPFETAGMTYYQATEALVEADTDALAHRRLIRLVRSQAKAGSDRAGDLGYLVPATGFLPATACGPSSDRGIPQALAATRLRACYRQSGIKLVPSNDQPAMDALNTRFDIYAGGFRSCRNYPPDLNVRKGFTTPGNADWCIAMPSLNWPMPNEDATPLPVDANMTGPGPSLNTDVALGDGAWNCAAYWGVAHFVGAGKSAAPPGCSAATISRYDVYRYELKFPYDRSRGAEFGAPQCVRRGETDRRVITMPIVNCGSSPVPVSNDAQGVPVAGFGRFFLVLPAEPATNGNFYAEFVGLVKRSDPRSTDQVQLYR